MNYWIVLFVAILGEVIGTTALKVSDGFSQFVPSLVVVLGYGVSFYCLALALRSIPLAIAYAVWSGVGVVAVSLVGWRLFEQKLNLWSIVGMALVVIGIVILNLSSRNIGQNL